MEMTCWARDCKVQHARESLEVLTASSVGEAEIFYAPHTQASYSGRSEELVTQQGKGPQASQAWRAPWPVMESTWRYY
ncbi:hypothetical protein E2C01_097287 [Portunus trituberculatus]|uniref:Uncharacterized protein n=1 Tax=Portunus trituberculatus TaxID=210409 RepID=A0A5B7K5C1_PORTR|nr:hypothetical protein [Portunus trituberculatus]